MKTKIFKTFLIILIIIIVAIAISFIYWWQEKNSKSSNGELQNKETLLNKSTCVDSDVNEKPEDIFTKGYVTYTDVVGKTTIIYDECTDSKMQVREMWCYESPEGSGNYVPGTQINDCPDRCLGGACVWVGG